MESFDEETGPVHPLTIHLLSLREVIRYGRLRALFWICTRELLADGATKGGLDRTPLVDAMEKGKYITQYELKAIRFDSKRAKEIASVRESGDLIVVGVVTYEESI